MKLLPHFQCEMHITPRKKILKCTQYKTKWSKGVIKRKIVSLLMACVSSPLCTVFFSFSSNFLNSYIPSSTHFLFFIILLCRNQQCWTLFTQHTCRSPAVNNPVINLLFQSNSFDDNQSSSKCVMSTVFLKGSQPFLMLMNEDCTNAK